jgi:DNA-binding transcriptional MerR regulator
VSPRSLRYYEQVGLIGSQRTPGGWRDFPVSAVDRVVTIQHLFAAGLGSTTIAQLLPCLEAPAEERTEYLDARLASEVQRLEQHKREIERELEVLRTLRREAGGPCPAGGA